VSNKRARDLCASEFLGIVNLGKGLDRVPDIWKRHLAGNKHEVSALKRLEGEG
jgi:hypothetical protein